MQIGVANARGVEPEEYFIGAFGPTLLPDREQAPQIAGLTRFRNVDFLNHDLIVRPVLMYNARLALSGDCRGTVCLSDCHITTRGGKW